MVVSVKKSEDKLLSSLKCSNLHSLCTSKQVQMIPQVMWVSVREPSYSNLRLKCRHAPHRVRWTEYIALLQMWTLETKNTKARHTSSLWHQLASFGNDDTTHQKCNSSADGVGTLWEPKPRQSTENQILNSSLCSDKYQLSQLHWVGDTSHEPFQRL